MTPKSLVQLICSAALGGILVMLCLGRLAFILPPLDWFSHFPGTALVGSLVLTGLLACIRFWKGVWLGIATILLSVILLAGPYLGSDSTLDGTMESNLVVATANVLASNTRLDEVTAILPDADVISLIETTSPWSRVLPAMKDRWPFQWSDLRDNPFGISVLTRSDVRSSEWIMLTPGGFPAFKLQINVDDIPVTILSVHAMSPQSLHMLSMRDAQFRMLSELIQEIPGNLILMGDLNASLWSSSLLKLMQETGLRNSRWAMGLSGIESGTWPVQAPAIMRLPIDHCLVRGNIRALATRTFMIPGADHLGLEVELAVRGETVPESNPKRSRWNESMTPWAMFWRSVDGGRDSTP